ncbi:MAG: hypothetical protein WA125_10520 [Desulfosporosinus sp.]
MSKRKEGIKELKLLGAAMAKMEAASELAQLKDKGPQVEQAQLQKAQLFEQLAQQAQGGEQRARNFNNWA